MNNIDKQYQDLLKDILENGTKKETRNGGTISVFGRQIRHKMSDGFPLLTTKKMAFKTMVTELLWFLRGDTNIKYLVDNNCHIWDGDCYQAYLKSRNKTQQEYKEKWGDEISNNPLTQEEFINKIKTDDEFAKKWGSLGKIYGHQWRRWTNYTGDEINEGTYEMTNEPIDQISELIRQLKDNPDSRRLLISAWNPAEVNDCVLPPCHYGFQVYTRELSMSEKELWYKNNNTNPNEPWYPNFPTRAISLMWNQRSVDTFLGLPFNIASYGLLLEIIAKEVNMVPDELIGNLGDTHLYLNHIEQAKEQIGRKYTHEERHEMLKTAMGDFYQTAVDEQVPFGGGISEYYDSYKIPKFTREPYPLPKLQLNPIFLANLEHKGFDEAINGQINFELENYQSHPTIKAPLSN